MLLFEVITVSPGAEGKLKGTVATTGFPVSLQYDCTDDIVSAGWEGVIASIWKEERYDGGVFGEGEGMTCMPRSAVGLHGVCVVLIHAAV